MQLMKTKNYTGAVVSNQIGQIRRMASLRVHHWDNKKKIDIHVATVAREMTCVGDYMLGSFGDSLSETFEFQFGTEIRAAQRNGLVINEFLETLDKVDRDAVEFLLEDYAKEFHDCII